MFGRSDKVRFNNSETSSSQKKYFKEVHMVGFHQRVVHISVNNRDGSQVFISHMINTIGDSDTLKTK